MKSIETDPYPSRDGGKTQILPRQDPVVHGDAAHGPLSPEQVRTFADKGYLHFERFFGEDELIALQEELGRIFDQNQAVRTNEVIREPESDVIRSVFRVHATDWDRRWARSCAVLLKGRIFDARSSPGETHRATP